MLHASRFVIPVGLVATLGLLIFTFQNCAPASSGSGNQATENAAATSAVALDDVIVQDKNSGQMLITPELQLGQRYIIAIARPEIPAGAVLSLQTLQGTTAECLVERFEKLPTVYEGVCTKAGVLRIEVAIEQPGRPVLRESYEFKVISNTILAPTSPTPVPTGSPSSDPSPTPGPTPTPSPVPLSAFDFQSSATKPTLYRSYQLSYPSTFNGRKYFAEFKTLPTSTASCFETTGIKSPGVISFFCTSPGSWHVEGVIPGQTTSKIKTIVIDSPADGTQYFKFSVTSSSNFSEELDATKLSGMTVKRDSSKTASISFRPNYSNLVGHSQFSISLDPTSGGQCQLFTHAAAYHGVYSLDCKASGTVKLVYKVFWGSPQKTLATKLSFRVE